MKLLDRSLRPDRLLCEYPIRMETISGGEGVAERPANLSVNSDRLEALAAKLRSKQRELWLAENQEAIAAYNEHVAQNGAWSDGRRGF
jgi:antitoxin CcdA